LRTLCSTTSFLLSLRCAFIFDDYCIYFVPQNRIALAFQQSQLSTVNLVNERSTSNRFQNSIAHACEQGSARRGLIGGTLLNFEFRRTVRVCPKLLICWHFSSTSNRLHPLLDPFPSLVPSTSLHREQPATVVARLAFLGCTAGLPVQVEKNSVRDSCLFVATSSLFSAVNEYKNRGRAIIQSAFDARH
jgi:hypothetical protein